MAPARPNGKFVSRPAIALAAVLTTLGSDKQSLAQPASSSSSPQVVQVPVVDARGYNDAFLRVAAARESKDAVVLVFYGTNKETYNKVRQAAAQVSSEGFPVKGIFVAKGLDAVEIYVDTLIYATHASPGPGIDIQTRGAVRDAYRLILTPKHQAGQVTTPAGAATPR